MHPACGIYYFEVEILQKGPKGYVVSHLHTHTSLILFISTETSASGACSAVLCLSRLFVFARLIRSSMHRFAAAEVRLSRLPGLEKHSWGYHADGGSCFSADHKNGITYGASYDCETHSPCLKNEHCLMALLRLMSSSRCF